MFLVKVGTIKNAESENHGIHFSSYFGRFGPAIPISYLETI